MKNNKVIILGLLTLLFFGIGGILIIELYNERSFLEELVRGWDISLQVVIGTLYGLTSSLFCIMIINREFFKAERQYYQKKIANFEINNFNIILISLCAGIGEEIFFRAALQPILGIWTTAIIFVMLHGYINPFNWRISIYGFLMIFVMAGIGYLYDKVGLISVMVAHSAIDIVLFKLLLKSIKNEIEV